MIGYNTDESPGDLKTLAITPTQWLTTSQSYFEKLIRSIIIMIIIIKTRTRTNNNHYKLYGQHDRRKNDNN